MCVCVSPYVTRASGVIKYEKKKKGRKKIIKPFGIRFVRRLDFKNKYRVIKKNI